MAAALERQYEAWFTDVTSGRDFRDGGIARIAIGAMQENPVRLTRQDWRGPSAGWTPNSRGHWQVDVRRTGAYDVVVRFAALAAPGRVRLSIGTIDREQPAPAGATRITFDDVGLSSGAATPATSVRDGSETCGALDIVVTKR